MEDAPLSYDTLLDLLRMERRKNHLIELPIRFWEDLRAYLQASEAEFRTEQEKDPFSRRVRLLTDEVIHARDAADALWALRERKVAMQALAHVRTPGDAKGLLPSEGPLYDDLLGVLQGNRDRIFEGTVASPSARAPPPAAPSPAAAKADKAKQQEAPDATEPEEAPLATAAPDQTTQETPESARTPEAPLDERDAAFAAERDEAFAAERDETDAEAPPEAAPSEAPAPEPESEPGPAKEPVTVPSDTPAPDAVTIRAKGDIPPFVGPDMETYLLKEGDIATVPQTIADLLVRRDKATVVQDAVA